MNTGTKMKGAAALLLLLIAVAMKIGFWNAILILVLAGGAGAAIFCIWHYRSALLASAQGIQRKMAAGMHGMGTFLTVHAWQTRGRKIASLSILGFALLAVGLYLFVNPREEMPATSAATPTPPSSAGGQVTEVKITLTRPEQEGRLEKATIEPNFLPVERGQSYRFKLSGWMAKKPPLLDPEPVRPERIIVIDVPGLETFRINETRAEARVVVRVDGELRIGLKDPWSVPGTTYATMQVGRDGRFKEGPVVLTIERLPDVEPPLEAPELIQSYEAIATQAIANTTGETQDDLTEALKQFKTEVERISENILPADQNIREGTSMLEEVKETILHPFASMREDIEEAERAAREVESSTGDQSLIEKPKQQLKKGWNKFYETFLESAYSADKFLEPATHPIKGE